MTGKSDLYSHIRRGEKLVDDDIDYFAYLLHSKFGYEVRECWYIQCPEMIEPLNPRKTHIQILHSCEGDFNISKISNGHWVCSYYDTKNIYIFDSIRSNVLHQKHRIFLSKCFPDFSLESKIIFPEVQVQPNDVDCGVYAIAFATSLALGEWPIEKSFRYDHDQMRPHLLQMFINRTVSMFPRILNNNVNNANNIQKNVMSRLHFKEVKVDCSESVKKLFVQSIEKSAKFESAKISKKINYNSDNSNNNNNDNNNVNKNTNQMKNKNFIHTIVSSQEGDIINHSKLLNAQMEDSLNSTLEPHSLNEKQLSLIMKKDEKLYDYHIDSFAYILHKNFNYCFRESWKIQLPELIEPLNPKKVHIQLLYSCEGDYDSSASSNGHWVCSYYDTKNIYIFDSNRSKALHEKHRLFLSKCFPDYSLESKIIFPEVQVQPNGVDCGVYAIAFATSLALGEWPVEKSFRYDHDQMRPHLLQIFQSGIICNFPKEIPVSNNHTGKKSKRKYKDHEDNPKSTSAYKRSRSKNIINNNNNNKTDKNNDNQTTKSNVIQLPEESLSQNRGIFQESKKISDNINDFNKRKVNEINSIHTPAKKKRKIIELPILNVEYLNIITQGNRLTDAHMFQFQRILANCSNYNHRDTLFLQRLDKIEPVPQLKKHIQILYSRNQHWVCSFYDTKRLYIYDSAKKNSLNSLNDDQKTFLQRLHPYISFNTNSLIFPLVQQQTNGNDCGVFSIAFATSLVFQQNPAKIVYDVNLMRLHLLSIFKTNTLTHFPVISNQNKNTLLDLSVIRKKEISSLSYRRKRYGDSSATVKKGPVPNVSSSEVPQHATDNKTTKFQNVNSDHLNSAVTISSLTTAIIKGHKLIYEHIHHFKSMLEDCSDYIHRDPSNLEKPERIECVPKLEKHIQILYSRDDHWVCSFYDTKKLRVYDSRNKGSLNDDQTKFLQHLFPHLDINSTSVIFPKVQFQVHKDDSGIFAIAFAVSLLFRRKPDDIIYDLASMRSHLSKMFQTRIITHFPEVNDDVEYFSDLKEIRKKERTSLYNRRRNERKLKQLDCQQEEINSSSKKPSSTSKCTKKTANATFEKKNSEQVDHKQKSIREQRFEILRKNFVRMKHKTCDQKVEDDKVKTAKKIKSKYQRNKCKQDGIKLKLSVEQCIQKLTEVIDKKSFAEKRLEAERIVKWCLCQRKNYVVILSRTLTSLKSKAEFHLSKLTDSLKTIDNYKLVCGKSLHNSSTEAYFYDVTYLFQEISNQVLTMNSKGQCTNILPLLRDSHGKKQWFCNNYCRTNHDAEIYEQYIILLQDIQARSLKSFSMLLKKLFFTHHSIDKLGHFQYCYESLTHCGSSFIPMELLSSHFPAVRYIKRLIYRMKEHFNKVNILDCALETSDLETLVNITNEMKRKGTLLDEEQNGICLDEDLLQEQYKSAFTAFTKRSLDLPRHKCISCQKLNFRKDITDLNKIRNPILTETWQNLNNFIQTRDLSLSSNYICTNTCLKKLRANELPSTCILNKMYVGSISNEIRTLNNYERILIQRAKAFQVVERLGTVAKKKLPHTMRIQKLKGQTFHLPLPIEETLKKICSTTDPINTNHELYILIRSLPTKSHIVWESLVNLEKIFSALLWYKKNNPLYAEIAIPDCPENLKKWLVSKNLEFNFEPKDDEQNNIEVQDDTLNDISKFVNNNIKIDDKELNCAAKSNNDTNDTGKNVDMPIDSDSDGVRNPNHETVVTTTINSLIHEDHNYSSPTAMATNIVETSENPNNYDHNYSIPLNVTGSIIGTPGNLNDNDHNYSIPLNMTGSIIGTPGNLNGNEHSTPINIIVDDHCYNIHEIEHLNSCTYSHNKLSLSSNKEHDILDASNCIISSQKPGTNLKNFQSHEDVHNTSQLQEGNQIDTDNEKIQDDSNIKQNDPRAMLTQIINPNSSQYEHCTIYPLHDKRINETSTNMYQMLKINDKPLDNRVQALDLLCFPDIYPYGVNGQHEKRDVKLSDHEYIKTRLKSADPRFRLNQQYLFFLLHDANIRQLGQGIYHTLNVINPRERYTAESYLKNLNSGQLEANLSTVFARLRNSAQFWSKPRNNLHCMTRHYGPATWFVTVSPAEWLWQDLIDYVREVNSPTFDKLSSNEVIAADPVSVSRFINNKFTAILDFITSDSHPLGKVLHYYWRLEYQGRGIQHLHMLFWIEGAPIMGMDSNDEVAEFIMKYVTCKLPNKNISPNLHRRVTSHQQHYHNDYCLRTKKLKSNKVVKACKFGFPRPVTDNFVLRDPATSIAGRRGLKSKSRLYDLPRTDKEVNINDYNPTLLSVWEGNMDIQFLGEKSTLLTQYVTKYVTKEETAKSSETVSEINSTKTLAQLLWKIAFRSLNHREIGAHEAADTLLGHSLYGTDSDTVIKWLDVKMIRNRKLKTKEEIEKLKESDPESTDIFCPSIIDDYYPNRPEELEFVCLYDFARGYDVVKTEPQNNINEYYKIGPSTFLKRRSRSYLINHFRYNVANQPENYFYSLLLLFQPWRDTDELKNGCQSYTESFMNQKSMLEQAKEYHEYNEDFQKGLDYIKKQIEKETNNENEENNQRGIDNESQEPADPAEMDMLAKELKDAANKVNNKLTLDEMIKQMNPDQLRIFEKIKDMNSKNEKIMLYVSGEGGTGKSFLIHVIKRWVQEKLNQETVVAAPTGIAAFNIDGLTIHRVFQLPVEHGFTPRYTQLSDIALKMLRDQLKNVTLIIIDEISMVSNITLLYIHLRLVSIFDVQEWFGGRDIIVFGDLLQLPPVHEDPTYKMLSSSDAEKLVGSISCNNLWADLFSYEELTINMRQKTDTSYAELLSRMRIGAITSEDIKLLEKRKINIDNSLSYQERLNEICNYINNLSADTVCLVPTCKQCDLINSVMLDKIQSEEIILSATDHIDCPKFLRKKASKTLSSIEEDASRTAGLPKIIKLKVGAKVMLRRNIDVTCGLVNGAIGTVKSISKSIETNQIQSINIDFASGKEYSIEKILVKFLIFDKAFVVREQFPLCLSYAVTIHKSQGLSLKNAVIEAGNTIFNVGQSYVAFSRVTKIEGLHLINFDPNSIKANIQAITEYNRLRKAYRADLPEIVVTEKRWSKVWDLIWGTAKYFDQNAPENMMKKKPCIDLLKFYGIENCDENSSCLISIFQCIVHSKIMQLLLNENGNSEFSTELYKLFEIYMNNKTILKSSIIKENICKQMITDDGTNPFVILSSLFNGNDDINKLVQYELLYTDRCNSCNYTTTYKVMNNILSLEVENGSKVITLQELIEQKYGHWINTLKFCNTCQKGQKTYSKVTLNSCQQIMVIKLNTFETKNNKSLQQKGSIKSVPTSKIILCNNSYTVVSAIFCHNKNGESNHYTAIIKNKSAWLEIDDLNVKSIRWPTNAKNVDLLFLERK